MERFDDDAVAQVSKKYGGAVRASQKTRYHALTYAAIVAWITFSRD